MRTQSLRAKLLQPLRILLSLSVAFQVLLPAAAVTTYASSVASAAFTGGSGTVSVGGTLYAKNGGALTLTVNTSSDTKCVDVTGAFTLLHQTSTTAKSIWTFSFTAGTGDGVQSVTATAMPNFNANNCTGQSGTGTASFVLDNTGPTVTATLSPAANAAGWNNSNVSITWSATDGGSGVGSGPTPASDNQNQNGISTHTSTASDRLGNAGTGSVTVKLDKMTPSISGSRAPAANANGWNNTDVTASFSCSDAVSGLKSCSGPTTLSTQGANQSVTGTAVDTADNSASATVSGISIDKTAPTLTGTPTTPANGNGWYNANVTIHWTASDALSGLASAVPADSTITGEGSGLTATASISDKAGNTTTATSVAVNIDKTAPNTTANAPASWQNANFTVTLTPVDALSGVANTFYKLDGGAQQTGTSVSISSEGDHTLDFWSVDKAGNVEATKTARVKLDKTAPTITHTQSPAANANGWNKSDVNVTFSCSDALSGIASCTSLTTVSVETAGQVVSGTAADTAGNTASDSVTVKLDKTAPSLNGAPTSSPNGAGWYNTSVAIHWVCTDSLSGFAAAACPTDSTISSEGTGLTASTSVSDQAGNTTTANSSPAVKIDKTAPNTTATAPSNWNNTDVTVSLNATDALSGVASTLYKLDGSTQQSGVSVPISVEGVHTLEFWSVDNAGNTEASKSVQVKIDKTPPTINHTQAPAANANGWNNTNVTVTFSCSDALSGIASCTAAQTVTTEGKDEPVTGTAVDNANNSATDPATVSIDKTAPTISAAADRAANANGWYHADVSVSFTCADPAPLAGSTPSGVTSCAPAQTFHEGGNQSASGSVADAAGNTASTSLNAINVDKTKPSLSGAPTTDPNPAGWFGGDVTIHWTCSDALSSIDGSCPPDATLSGEGSALTAAASVSDKAGNSTGADIAPAVNIDRTPPTISGSRGPDANPNGWNNGDVIVTFTCADALSGVAACTGPQTISTEGTNQSVDGSASDNAGHSASARVSNINIDKTPPTISATADRAANANGWYNSDVVVSFSCSDALSGIASCPAAATLSEGTNQTASGTTTDLAGNSASASVTGINVDKTAPTLSGVATTSPNANGWYNGDVTIHWTASDGLSGLVAAPADSLIIGEGDSLSASAAVSDRADNSTNASVSGIKIDRTAPHTSVSVPDPLASGWYAGAVQVTLTGVDYLSGIATTYYKVDNDAPQTYGGAFNDNVRGVHTLTFWSADKAGNVEDNTAASNTITIKIDDIAPSTGATTTPVNPNSAGWFNALSITLSAADAESGVAHTFYQVDASAPQTYTDTFTYNQDGIHTITYWSVDNANNVEDALVKQNRLNISFDSTPPTITGVTTPAANGFGWNNADVTVSFTCTDATSGVTSSDCTAPVLLQSEGAGQSVTGFATDGAGNTSSTTVSNISIDKTAPTLTGAATTVPTGTDASAHQWYRGDVTIHWTVQDGLSGVDPATVPADSTVTGEGFGRSTSAYVKDKAGNTGSGNASINIDRTAPVISGGPTTLPNTYGWYNKAVTVHFSCTDNLSGVATCPSDEVVSANGANQSVTSDSATDVAGNSSAGKAVGGINIDGTAPQTSANNQCDGANGWCRGQTATVVLTAADQAGLSGVKEIHYFINGGPEKVVSGASYSVNVPLAARSGLATVEFFAVDNAGNQESRSGVSLKYDNIAPAVTHTLAPAANADGWNNVSTTVHFDAKDDDGGSGVDPSTVTPDQSVISETTVTGLVVNGQAKDMAGNLGTDSVTVKLDKTAPSVSAAATTNPNVNGWYKGPVTVHFTCGDALSGVVTCPADQTLSASGTNLSASGTVVDHAGNSATAKVTGINIDTGAPTITINGVADGAVYTLGSVPAGSCSAVDPALFDGSAGSGLDVNGCKFTAITSTTNVGKFTFSATATDKAGNSTTVTGSYSVRYRFDGFLQPINDTGHLQTCGTGCIVSVFKAGSTVPVKFQLKDANGNVVQAPTLPIWLSPTKGNPTTAPVDESAFTDLPTSGGAYRWDSTAQQYIYNYGTGKNQAGNYWRIYAQLDDGTTQWVDIGLR